MLLLLLCCHVSLFLFCKMKKVKIKLHKNPWHSTDSSSIFSMDVSLPFFISFFWFYVIWTAADKAPTILLAKCASHQQLNIYYEWSLLEILQKYSFWPGETGISAKQHLFTMKYKLKKKNWKPVNQQYRRLWAIYCHNLLFTFFSAIKINGNQLTSRFV